MPCLFLFEFMVNIQPFYLSSSMSIFCFVLYYIWLIIISDAYVLSDAYVIRRTGARFSQPNNQEVSTKKRDEDDEDNWDMPDEALPY